MPSFSVIKLIHRHKGTRCCRCHWHSELPMLQNTWTCLMAIEWWRITKTSVNFWKFLELRQNCLQSVTKQKSNVGLKEQIKVGNGLEMHIAFFSYKDSLFKEGLVTSSRSCCSRLLFVHKLCKRHVQYELLREVQVLQETFALVNALKLREPNLLSPPKNFLTCAKFKKNSSFGSIFSIPGWCVCCNVSSTRTKA